MPLEEHRSLCLPISDPVIPALLGSGCQAGARLSGQVPDSGFEELRKEMESDITSRQDSSSEMRPVRKAGGLRRASEGQLTYPASKYSLGACCRPGAVLGTRVSAASKADKNPVFTSLPVRQGWEGTEKTQRR